MTSCLQAAFHFQPVFYKFVTGFNRTSVTMETTVKPGWSLDKRDPAFIQSQMPTWDYLYRYYFRVRSEGWHHIPPGKIMLVGSHNGGLASPDLGMIMYDWFRRFGTDRPVYGLMHQKIWMVPWLAENAEKMGAIAAHPKVAEAAFKRGAGLLVFPGGGQDAFRPFHQWNRINLEGRKGFIRLAIRHGVPIVPFVSAGAHHTLIVLADLYPALKELNRMGMRWPFDIDPEVYPLYLGIPWGLAVGPMPNIPLPAQIFTRICKPIVLCGPEETHLADDRAFVQHAYEHVLRTMQEELDQLIETTPYK